MMRRFTKLLLASVALLQIVAGCRDAVGPLHGTQQNLSAARVRWSSQNVADYTYLVSFNCFCASNGPIRIVVRGSKVQSATVAQTGLSLTDAEARAQPTVDTLFAIVQRSIDAHPAHLDVSFDPVDGHPIRIFLDWSESVADDELEVAISNFTRP